MLKAISTYVQVKERLHPGMLDAYARMGAQAIEIFAARGHFDYTNRQHVREIGQWFKTSGVDFHSMHSPMYRRDELRTRRRRRRSTSPTSTRRHGSRRWTRSSARLKSRSRCRFRFLIQHIGTSGE